MGFKNNLTINSVFVLISISFLCSCDYIDKVVIIKNNSRKPVFYIFPFEISKTDSSVNEFYTNQKQYILKPDSLKNLFLFNTNLKTQPDSSKVSLYIFDIDSLNKYKKVASFKNMMNRSLIKKIEIQLNKVKEPVDTVYVFDRKNL